MPTRPMAKCILGCWPKLQMRTFLGPCCLSDLSFSIYWDKCKGFFIFIFFEEVDPALKGQVRRWGDKTHSQLLEKTKPGSGKLNEKLPVWSLGGSSVLILGSVPCFAVLAGGPLANYCYFRNDTVGVTIHSVPALYSYWDPRVWCHKYTGKCFRL